MYRYQLEHFIGTGERPENVSLPPDGLLWTNQSGFARRPSLEYYYGADLPETFATIRAWEGRAGFAQYTSGPDLYWFTDMGACLDWIRGDYLIRLQRPDRYNTEWDWSRFAILARPPEPEHRKGFPSLVETALHIIGLPPEARRRPPFQSCLDTQPPEDLVDPVTGLVPVFLVRERRGADA